MVNKTNLISYWKLDESSGTITDSHGSNDGTNNGATYGATGKINTALDFDGSNDYVNFGDIDVSDDEISIACWIKVDAFTNSFILAKDQASGREWSFGITSAGKIQLQPGGAGPSTASTTTLSTGTWYHVGVTYSSTSNSGTYYLNGVADGTFTSAGNISSTSTPLYMGQRAYGGDPYFNGTIDECGLWDAEISADDFSYLYNNAQGFAYPFTLTTDDLLAYYKLDETSGTTVTDATGNNGATNTSATVNVSGKINTAYDFSGGASYVLSDSTSGIGNGGEFTLNCWVNLDTVTDGDDVIYIGDTNQGIDVYSGDFGHGYWGIYVQGIGHAESTVSSSGDIGSWVMVTATYDGTNLILYRNGTQIASTTGTSANVDGKIRLATNFGGSQTTDGQMDEVSVWGRALSVGEVVDLYNSDQGLAYPFEVSTDDLISYYNCNESTGDLVDVHSTYDLTESGTVPSQTGILNTARGAFTGTQWFQSTSVPGANVTQAFSDNLWVYRTGTIGTESRFFLRTSDTCGQLFYSLRMQTDNTLNFFIGTNCSGSGLLNLNSTTTIPLNEWTMITITHDTDGSTKLYINGELDGSGTETATHTDSTWLTVGNNNVGTAPLTNAYVDEIGTFDKVLGQTEIDLLYNNGSGLAYPFTAASSFDATDTQSSSDTFGFTLVGQVDFTETQTVTDSFTWFLLDQQDFSETQTTTNTVDFITERQVNSTVIAANNADIKTATVTADYTGNLPRIYLSVDGINWEQVTLNNQHTFTNTGQQLRYRLQGTGAGTVTKLSVKYGF